MTTEPQIEKAYSLSELAFLLGLTHQYLWELVKAGELRSFRLGKQHRIKESDVIAFLDRQQQKNVRGTNDNQTSHTNNHRKEVIT